MLFRFAVALFSRFKSLLLFRFPMPVLLKITVSPVIALFSLILFIPLPHIVGAFIGFSAVSDTKPMLF